MKKLTMIIQILVLAHTYLTAQVVTNVAPLKPGNKWIYYSKVLFQGKIKMYEVKDSVKIINSIPFYYVTGDGNSALLNNGFYARHDESMPDSLYKYFKINPKLGDEWQQNLANIGTTLYSTIIDTFSAPVFNKSTLIFVVDRTDSGVVGSREYWTEEFGLLNGLYEQAEDILKGCVIEGVVYGDTLTVGINDEEELPTEFVLYQNYPNPFNPITKIKYSIPQSGNIQIKAYNILGSELATLVNEYKQAGTYEVEFNASAMGLPSGVYFYSLRVNDFVQNKKMTLLK